MNGFHKDIYEEKIKSVADAMDRNDLRTMNPEIIEILTYKDMIVVNHRSACRYHDRLAGNRHERETEGPGYLGEHEPGEMERFIYRKRYPGPRCYGSASNETRKSTEKPHINMPLKCRKIFSTGLYPGNHCFLCAL